MVIADVLHQHNVNSPPLQPFVGKYSDTYLERQITWNPKCVKKDALFYQFRTNGDESEDIEIVADGCFNILFELDSSNPRSMLSGAFNGPRAPDLKPNTTYFGFKPYSSLGFKSPKTNLLLPADTNTDFSCVFPGTESLVAEISEAAGFSDRIGIFMKYASENLIDFEYTPTFIDYMALMICSSKESIRSGRMAEAIGYSERHCRKKFKDRFGIPPKQYSSIIRFQNTLKSLLSGSYEDMSSLALERGYFDQSHLIRDFKRYTNFSPETYLKKHAEMLKAASN